MEYDSRKKERKRGHKKGEYIKIFVIICFICLFCICLTKIKEEFFPANGILPTKEHANNEHTIKNENSDEWNLILVNRWNKIPDDYSVTLTELSNGRKVDSRIYPDLQEMFNAARADNVYPIVGEGYRTWEEQEQMFEDKVSEYINEGCSKRKAQKLAEQWVALPGNSEHQLGIAVDINADKIWSVNEEVYVWLSDNAYKYGFILRYPQNKEDITMTKYEPWHYRYVGKKAAEEIFSKKICLEEYLEKF